MLHAQWDNFEVNFSTFEEQIAEQKDRLRKDADNKNAQLAQELDKFYRRWSSQKPKASIDAVIHR